MGFVPFLKLQKFFLISWKKRSEQRMASRAQCETHLAVLLGYETIIWHHHSQNLGFCYVLMPAHCVQCHFRSLWKRCTLYVYISLILSKTTQKLGLLHGWKHSSKLDQACTKQESTCNFRTLFVLFFIFACKQFKESYWNQQD